MWNVLCAGLGGFIGASLRYLTGTAAERWLSSQPVLWATLTVNVMGCLAIGAIAGAMDARLAMAPATRIFLVVGVLGGFTTYSAFGLEVVNLARQDRLGAALLHVGLHLTLGLGAVAVGFAVARTA